MFYELTSYNYLQCGSKSEEIPILLRIPKCSRSVLLTGAQRGY